MAQRRLSQPEPVEPPLRPRLAEQPSRFVLLEREVELEYRPQMLEALQRKVNTVAEDARTTVPECPRCGQPMSYHDARPVSWLAHWGLGACENMPSSARLKCPPLGTGLGAETRVKAISSTPKACGGISYHPRRRRAAPSTMSRYGGETGGLPRLGQAFDLVTEVVEVAGADV